MKNITSLAVFDLDETLLSGDSSRLWTRYLWDKKIITDSQFLALDDQMIADYHAGKLNMDDYLYQHLSFYRNYNIETINQWVNNYIEECITPLLYPQGRDIIAQYQQQHIPVIIISATMSFLVHPIAKQLNADISMGIDMEMKEDHYTGYIDGIPTFREGKVSRLQQWMENKNINKSYIYFYTDSSNDLPLCYQADNVFTINADKQLAQIANKKGWTSLKWDLNK